VIAKALDVPSQAAARRLGTLIKKICDAIICALAANDAASTKVDMQRSLQLAVRSAAKSPSDAECPHRFSQSSSAWETLVAAAGRIGQICYVGCTPRGKSSRANCSRSSGNAMISRRCRSPAKPRRGDIRLIAGLREATLELRPGIAAHGTRRRKRIRHRRSPLFARASSIATIDLCCSITA
jgi:hypothetical protein